MMYLFLNEIDLRYGFFLGSIPTRETFFKSIKCISLVTMCISSEKTTKKHHITHFLWNKES